MGLSRRTLWISLGLLPQDSQTRLHELTEEIYRQDCEQEWRGRREEAPHGSAWHTAFHASSFPANGKACGRKALYSLLAIPEETPPEPWLVAVGEAGKDIETRIVQRWHKAGRLLTSPDSERQTTFVDPEHWLTCSPDAALDLRPDWPYVHVVDVKSKDHKAIEDLRTGAKEADPAHVAQVQVQVHFCRAFHELLGWAEMGLKPAIGGSLYYVSRQRPRDAYEVYVEYDETMIDAGLETLREWIDAFRAGALLPRPKEWMWTDEPCRWCRFKKHCKDDLRAETIRLEESKAINLARSIDPDYDYATVRAAVLNRWEEE